MLPACSAETKEESVDSPCNSNVKKNVPESAENREMQPLETSRTESQQTNRTQEIASQAEKKSDDSTKENFDSVKNFLGLKMSTILSEPDRVESFLVKPELADKPTAENQVLNGFPIKKIGSQLNDEQIKTFQKFIFDEKSYNFEVVKKCLFRPDLGLRFSKGEETVIVLLSFSCELWQFSHRDIQKIEDFDSITEKLLEFQNVLFSEKS